MKKYLLGLVVLLMGTSMLTSCHDDSDNIRVDGGGDKTQNDSTKTDSTKQEPVYVPYSAGAYIVNAGNMYSNIESTLTHIDFTTNVATQGVFKTANSRSLGNTANDGIVYGDKIYLVVDQSNTIEVVDRKTLKSIKQIKTTDLLGTTEGVEPRHIIAGSGHVYFTTYGGYVAAVDTVNYSLAAKYQVGKYPEGLVGNGQNIYVANCNYGMGGGNISVINVLSGTVSTIDIKDVNNPTKLFVANESLYVLDGQYYDASYNTYGENALRLVDMNAKTSTKVVECNYASLLTTDAGSTFYTVNAPYGSEEVPTFLTYDVTNATASRAKSLQNYTFSPCGIEVDPITGHYFILSYNPGESGYADYNGNGYVVEFDATGAKVGVYETGVGSCAIFFETGKKVQTTK